MKGLTSKISTIVTLSAVSVLASSTYIPPRNFQNESNKTYYGNSVSNSRLYRVVYETVDPKSENFYREIGELEEKLDSEKDDKKVVKYEYRTLSVTKLAKETNEEENASEEKSQEEDSSDQNQAQEELVQSMMTGTKVEIPQHAKRMLNGEIVISSKNHSIVSMNDLNTGLPYFMYALHEKLADTMVPESKTLMTSILNNTTQYESVEDITKQYNQPIKFDFSKFMQEEGQLIIGWQQANRTPSWMSTPTIGSGELRLQEKTGAIVSASYYNITAIPGMMLSKDKNNKLFNLEIVRFSR